MNEIIEITLLLNLFFYEDEKYTRNETFIKAERGKAISLLDEYADQLKEIDLELSLEYQETINYLENISDEEYQEIKKDLIKRVEFLQSNSN